MYIEFEIMKCPCEAAEKEVLGKEGQYDLDY